jgi:HK97 family phage major capsid protein
LLPEAASFTKDQQLLIMWHIANKGDSMLPAINEAPTYRLKLEKRMGVPTKRDRNREFETFLRFGEQAFPDEVRAQSVGTDSAGGYLVAQEFSDRLWSTLKATDALFDDDVVTIYPTETGAALVIPLIDDTASVATIIAENAPVTVANLAPFSQIILAKAPKWVTPLVQVSVELAQDSAFPFDQVVADAFVVQLRRGIGPTLVSSLISGAAVGVTAGAAAITADNIFDLFASVNSAYLESTKVGWLMNRATFTAIQKLPTADAHKVFPPAFDDKGRPLLLGLSVNISPSVPGIGTGNKSVLFGDLGTFIVRIVADSFRVKRLEERYMELLMLGFLGYARVNSVLARATGADSPVKFLQHA